MTVAEIKRKWRVLRTQYMQEVRAIGQSKKSGAGSSDVYIPKFWCFHQLQFLKTHSQNRQSKDNTEFTVDQTEISTCSTSEGNFSEESSPKQIKTSGAINGFRNDLKDFKTIVAQRYMEKKVCLAWKPRHRSNGNDNFQRPSRRCLGSAVSYAKTD